MGEKVTSWKFFLSMSADFSAQIINAIFHPFNYKVFAMPCYNAALNPNKRVRERRAKPCLNYAERERFAGGKRLRQAHAHEEAGSRS